MGPITNPGGQTLPDNNGAGSINVSNTSGTSACQQPSTNNGTGGANQTPGPYDATCVGQVQGGHPAGSEGKADNKNPQGQNPNGSDNNKGYECDQNPGIGNGNPAHTACVPGNNTPPPPTGCTANPTGPGCQTCLTNPDLAGCSSPGNPPPNCTPTATNNNCQPPACVPSGANNNCGQPTVVQGTSTSTCANGQTMVDGTCGSTSVEGETLVKPTSSNLAAPGVSVAGVALSAAPAGVAATSTSRTLPFTGSNTGDLAGLSLVLLVTGSLLVLVSRRRRPVSEELAFSGAGSHGGSSVSPSLVSSAWVGFAFGPASWERAASNQRRQC